ncbi:hypothetical protein FRB96_008212 [Tulasnella sp. 330]|nr:hypothetical protein FRB96_008212 [Tulasnella sp. 330]KAG8879097.1 hypothetical protein FRB97_002012 [Tulasnella sp. 331]KAG8885308.1 hypothetical protein FRB98_001847 [Tulasnella sp. 332]
MNYDQGLLQNAPASTKAEQRQGYDVDLLSEGPRPPPSNAYNHNHDHPNPIATEEKATHTDFSPTSKRLPFWRTRTGMAVIAILTIIIIGAIVGGAVGGTVGKHKSSPATMTGASDGSGGSHSGQTITVSYATTTINAPIS